MSCFSFFAGMPSLLLIAFICLPVSYSVWLDCFRGISCFCFYNTIRLFLIELLLFYRLSFGERGTSFIFSCFSILYFDWGIEFILACLDVGMEGEGTKMR